MEFEFEVNEDLVAANIIQKNFMDVDLANYLWEKYKDQYLLIQNKIYEYVFENPAKKSILEELKKHKIFTENLFKCKQNLERIQINLKESKPKIDNFLKSLMKLELNMKPQKVYIVPNCGMNVSKDTILWGSFEGYEDKNYDLVYLYHEALHSFFNNLKEKANLRDNDETDHVIIQYLTDIELAKYLGKKRYPTHKNIKDLEARCYPYMQMYFNKSDAKILKEMNEDNIYFEMEKYKKYRGIFKSFDIIKIYKWLLQNKKEILDVNLIQKLYIK